MTRLCMFTPAERELERGWPGRIDGDRVVQLAAQTLQAYFTGGSTAREHDVYPFAEVTLRAPVLHPPAIRLFDDAATFAFGNANAVCSPGATIAAPPGRADVALRVVAIVGAEEGIGGWTLMAEWRSPALPSPKDRDFSLVLGPWVESAAPDAFDWAAARDLAAANTRLRAGDLLAGPAVEVREDVPPGGEVVFRLPPFAALACRRAAPA